jgi:hypothetical protein
VVFGNTNVTILEEIRGKILIFTHAIQISLQLLSSGELLGIRQQLGVYLPEIKESLTMIMAKIISTPLGGSAASDFTVYPNDDRRFWKTCRRELVKAGFTSEVLKQGNRKELIKAYVAKLCQT